MTLPSDTLASAQGLLHYLRIFSPIVLLLAFVIAFIVSSIVSARQLTPTGTTACGPGGRPLPKRTRSTMEILKDRQKISPRFRLVFQWLAVVVLLTYVVDAAVIVTHAILYRSQHWWRGQATVVSSFHFTKSCLKASQLNSFFFPLPPPDLHCWMLLCACLDSYFTGGRKAIAIRGPACYMAIGYPSRGHDMGSFIGNLYKSPS